LFLQEARVRIQDPRKNTGPSDLLKPSFLPNPCPALTFPDFFPLFLRVQFSRCVLSCCAQGASRETQEKTNLTRYQFPVLPLIFPCLLLLDLVWRL